MCGCVSSDVCVWGGGRQVSGCVRSGMCLGGGRQVCGCVRSGVCVWGGGRQVSECVRSGVCVGGRETGVWVCEEWCVCVGEGDRCVGVGE